jgi:hypothetical protein
MGSSPIFYSVSVAALNPVFPSVPDELFTNLLFALDLIPSYHHYLGLLFIIATMFAIRRSGMAHWSAALFAVSTTHSSGPILRTFNNVNVRRATKFQRTEIQIVKGDITDEKTDAIGKD